MSCCVVPARLFPDSAAPAQVMITPLGQRETVFRLHQHIHACSSHMTQYRKRSGDTRGWLPVKAIQAEACSTHVDVYQHPFVHAQLWLMLRNTVRGRPSEQPVAWHNFVRFRDSKGRLHVTRPELLQQAIVAEQDSAEPHLTGADGVRQLAAAALQSDRAAVLNTCHQQLLLCINSGVTASNLQQFAAVCRSAAWVSLEITWCHL